MDKYEEALAKARAGKSLEEIFPEMKESEDERARKSLLAYIKGESKRLDTKKWIAYLEKQKEQTEELSTRLNGLMQEYVKSGKDEEEQEHRLKCYKLFWDALEDSEFFEQFKQKDPKPAEWSEEDERHLIWLCRIIHSRVVNKELSLAEESKLGKWIDKWINHGLQPVQKWDEFDEDCLKRAIWYIENPAPSVVKDTNLVLWLKSIPGRFNLPPKQEWDEEGERILKGIIGKIDHNQTYGVSKVEMLSFLKSIRHQPHTVSIKNATKFGNLEYERGVKDGIQSEKSRQWKPSEEQMEALSSAGMHPSLGAKNCRILQSLYSDLQKLL